MARKPLESSQQSIKNNQETYTIVCLINYVTKGILYKKKDDKSSEALSSFFDTIRFE